MPQFASARNIATFEKLFTEPEHAALATAFLEAFLPFKIASFEADMYHHNRLFHALGTYQDSVHIELEDTNGNQRLIEFSLLEMRLGNTSGLFKADQDYEYRVSSEGLSTFGKRIDELYFLRFTIDQDAGYHIQKQYNFNEPPYELRFNCFQLLQFDRSEEQLSSSQDYWLYWLCHDQIPRNMEKQLIPLIAWDNWNDDWRDTYQRRSDWHSERQQRTLKEENQLDKRFLEHSATDVDWHWWYVEKQIGAWPIRKVNPEEIDLSNLQKDLDKFAFPLFRQWTTNCKEKYPELNLNIENEQSLIKDLDDVIRRAIIDLYNYDPYYKDQCLAKKGVIYLAAFIQGKLGQHWYMEYVIKQSQEFKTCMALRSLSLWLSIEDTAAIKIDDIYNQALLGKVNLADFDTSILKIDLKSEKEEIVEPNEGRSKVHIVIENLLHEYIKKVSNMGVELFVGDISGIIADEILKKMLANSRDAFLMP